MSVKPALYTHPAAMEPLLPEGSGNTLADLTCKVLSKAGTLSAQVPCSIVQSRIASLVREMNSYYSNLMEGHKTLPRDIESALREEYSGDPKARANQHLNRSHIEVEQLMFARLESDAAFSIHSVEFLSWLHREFYSRLPHELHFTENKRGKRFRIEPGVLRTFEVEVGRHQPPHFKALPKIMARFEEFYGGDKIPATSQLVAMAAAHHRLSWIHPFGDGNGRVTRLYSHAWLFRCNVNRQGLWTLSRGLARFRREYYERLSNADQRRQNDWDGRGNLSDRTLAEFCVFMTQTMLDQIEFMSELLQLQNLSTRIERYLHLEILKLDGKTRNRLVRLLKAALVEGQIERGRVGEIVGLSSTSAREIIRLALKQNLLNSQTEKGPLSLVFSSKTLESYFPKLYQDLPAE
jgi:Fic family protein